MLSWNCQCPLLNDALCSQRNSDIVIGIRDISIIGIRKEGHHLHHHQHQRDQHVYLRFITTNIAKLDVSWAAGPELKKVLRCIRMIGDIQ